MTLSYAFGGNTGQSYDALQRRRAYLEAVQKAGQGTQPKTGAEGILSGLNSVFSDLMLRKLGKQEDANREAANQKALDLFGQPSQYGGGGASVPAYVPPDPNSPSQIGHDTMVALGKAPATPTKDEVSAYIAAKAMELGIDPSVAVAVANSEGLNANPADGWQSNFVKNGQREPSYGPFQLYMGGGLGNSFLEQTGLDPRDPTTWKKQVDFALGHAKNNGWGSWYGARNAGIGDFQGIGGQPQGASGIDPNIVAAMGDPNVSPEIKSALGMLLQQRIAAAQPPDPVNLQTFTGPDGATYSFNPVTGEAKPVTASKPLDPGYRLLSADESKRMGLPEGSYQVGPDNKISKVGGEGTNVTINNGGNSSKFSEESDKAAAARFDGYIQSGTAANQMMGDLRALADLAPQIGTGKTAEVMATLGPYAQALGIDVANLDESQAFKSIVDRLAPQMRPVGAGSSSDFDARQFLNSLPKLGNTPEGNQIILQTLEAVQKQKLAAAEIAQLAYISPDQGGITWQEAEKRIRALGNPYDAFNEYSKSKPKQPSPSSDPAPSPTSDNEYLKSLGLR